MVVAALTAYVPPMSASKSELSIHAAAMHCAARCVESDAPYAKLGDFLEKLSEFGWELAAGDRMSDAKTIEQLRARAAAVEAKLAGNIAESHELRAWRQCLMDERERILKDMDLMSRRKADKQDKHDN